MGKGSPVVEREPVSEVDATRLVRRHLAVTLAVTCVTSWFSYAYFHNDEYFQIIEYVRSKLGDIDPRYLPWEHAERMRPWLHPFLYWVVARALMALGLRDIFQLSFAFRLLTGLANMGALALFLRTTVPWMKSREETILHVRVATLAGFLPYLFVRTSSESASMAALTAGFALLLEGAAPQAGGRTWAVPALARRGRPLLAGLAFGVAFEMRFQTAFIALGVMAWLLLVGRATWRAAAGLAAGGGLVLATCGLVDRWGYGVWTFPAWSYVRVNLVEGAASRFGTDPPLSYFWLLPANIFFPVIAVLLVLAVVAWTRCPRHPVTWATLPFFVVHNLIAHKEERFLFPVAVLSTAFVTMAIGPSFGGGRFAARLTEPFALWAWRRRRGFVAKALATSSAFGMLVLTFIPLGLNHNVRFMRFVHDRFGDEFRATVLPDLDVSMPAFHPRFYDVDRATAEEVSQRIEAGVARPWIVTDDARLRSGTSLDAHATLVFSELPGFQHPRLAEHVLRGVRAYNTWAPSSLRRLRFRSLYQIQ